ncbi:hypothetical protein QMZ65_22480 [Pantoea sp. EABMAA-21]|uniref:DUF6904 family protein n=1 Tax=Pantoea sp. EABMAA-21 TaxID=3043302 RepID=UPI0024B60EF0|nr:hypothetical protein [Pantoea sp. EABMAA-21]MDI9279989.1 hypothetical protein [Pantoea sp. EABMAA-21]
MFRFDLTPNNAGIVFWGDKASLNELYECIHYIVDESPLIKNKEGFILALAYDIRKAREGQRRTEEYLYDFSETYQLYGVELLWPLVLLQAAMLRISMSYIETDKSKLSVMYAFEFIIESALKQFSPDRFEEITRSAKNASNSDFDWIEDSIDSRCCYFINQSSENRKEQLNKIMNSLDSFWAHYTREKQDVKMLSLINNTDWEWPEDITW